MSCSVTPRLDDVVTLRLSTLNKSKIFHIGSAVEVTRIGECVFLDAP
jgi:hypothetical protein